MSQELILQDLVIVIAAKNHKPNLLNLDFLKCSGIVPDNWELARQPIHASNVSQVIFTNGIAVTAEPQRVMLAQSVKNIDTESILIPEIAVKYAQALPNMEFEAVGINPRGYVPYPNQEQDTANHYITKTLLSPGAWQSVGEAPMRASLNLVYKLPRAPLYLTVTEAALQAENVGEEVTPIIMFSGSYSYPIGGEKGSEKLAQLHGAINNYQSDLEEFLDIVNNKFLPTTQPKSSSAVESNLEINNNSDVNSLFAMSV